VTIIACEVEWSVAGDVLRVNLGAVLQKDHHNLTRETTDIIFGNFQSNKRETTNITILGRQFSGGIPECPLY
jgi:hypothetical protein